MEIKFKQIVAGSYEIHAAGKVIGWTTKCADGSGWVSKDRQDPQPFRTGTRKAAAEVIFDRIKRQEYDKQLRIEAMSEVDWLREVVQL